MNSSCSNHSNYNTNNMYHEGTVYNPAVSGGSNNTRDMILEGKRLGEQRVMQMQNQAHMHNQNSGMYNLNASTSNMMMVPQNGSNMMSNWQQTTSVRPESLTNPDFLPAYLQQHIGKWVRVDFLIGGGIEQRVGILQEVGASYIILNVIEPATLLVCDMFSIKFVTVVLDDDFTKLTL